MQVIIDWYNRRFSDPQVVILLLALVVGFAVVLTFGKILAPLLTAMVFAYLLEGTVRRLEGWGVRRIAGVSLVFLGFVVVQTWLVFGVIPLLWRQGGQFVDQIPTYAQRFEAWLSEVLVERYPEVISQDDVTQLVSDVTSEMAGLRELASLDALLSGIGLVMGILVFLVLVPILIFFLLKDKDKILRWLRGIMPKERGLVNRVWHEVDLQIGNYVRGKVLEILIVGAVSFVTFQLLGLQYAILLATIVGFSVVIPYIGAAMATIPVAVVGYAQFGWTGDFLWVMIAYGIIQMLDGNVLVPWMFSEVVDLHPVAIIVAVLVFGGIWGFWGVFFAIPLATLFNAVLRALPGKDGRVENTPDDPTDSDDQTQQAAETA